MIKAFVVLHGGHDPDEALRTDLMAHCRRRLGAAVSPREIDFAESLPHTRSGKIMRRVLRARELGEDEGRHVDTRDGGVTGGRCAMTRFQLDGVTADEARGLLADMIRVRVSRSGAPSCTRESKIRGFLHLYIGEEAVAAGVIGALDAADNVARHLP